MISFTVALVALTAAIGVVAAPVNDPADITISKRSSPNSSGTNNGFFYQFWTDGAGGSATYTNKDAGEYSVTWTQISDMTSGKGWKNAAPRNITFTGTVNAQGNFYLAVYTWSQKGENYILENYGTYNPCSGGKTVGTLTSDGSAYQICTVDRGNNYIQNWSIRQQKRSSGTVTTSNHYNFYQSHGLTHNPLSDAAYQIVSTEGYGGSGSADIVVKADA
ncbi:glycoside hydrolase family 11 protein [Periconia macrospinosa]|uniref:endo-1,4-beta-xylanase n=1 Tax=Periconia macrospinosa TaxID=97972 RepID=A0A2V1DDG1_9PLEO|nr:glycoside hydrolase family 11 protein [Periconia macrospinosa]